VQMLQYDVVFVESRSLHMAFGCYTNNAKIFAV